MSWAIMSSGEPGGLCPTFNTGIGVYSVYINIILCISAYSCVIQWLLIVWYNFFTLHRNSYDVSIITDLKTHVSFSVLPFLLPSPPKRGVKRQKPSPSFVLDKFYRPVEVCIACTVWNTFRYILYFEQSRRCDLKLVVCSSFISMGLLVCYHIDLSIWYLTCMVFKLPCPSLVYSSISSSTHWFCLALSILPWFREKLPRPHNWRARSLESYLDFTLHWLLWNILLLLLLNV